MPNLQASELRKLVDEQCDAFEKAWATGEQPTLGEFLETVPEEGRRELFRELLALELELTARAGRRPNTIEIRNQYPAYREIIEQAFDEFQSWTDSRGAPADLPLEFGRYILLKVLGRGGMGVVYQARDTRLKRLVAVKMLIGAEHAPREEKERFRAEAEAAARLQHANIVQVFEVGERRGQHYIVFEYVDGPNLAELVGGHPLDPCAAAKLVRDLSLAMRYAHERQIVHRDLKPSNVLIADERSNGNGHADKSQIADGVDEGTAVSFAPDDSTQTDLSENNGSRDDVKSHLGEEFQPTMPAKASRLGAQKVKGKGGERSLIRELPVLLASGKPKITDFGLAKRLDSDRELTMTGAVFGTPQYMSPEQAAGSNSVVGPATDIYSLGAILYYLLTGRAPFDASSAAETLRMVLEQPPPSPHLLAPHLPADIVTICMRCLEKDPTRRYLSAEDLSDELSRFLRAEPILARPVGQIVRAVRWCRRNPTVSALLATCLFLFLTGFAAVTWKWREAADNAVTASRASKKAAKNEVIADEARLSMQRQMSRLFFHRGIEKCEQDERYEGLHWLVESLRVAPNGTADEPWRTIVRSNLSGWRARTPAHYQRCEVQDTRYVLTWSPQGQMIVLGGLEGKIRRIDTKSGGWIGEPTRIGISQEGWSSISGLSFHPSGNWFMAAASSEIRDVGHKGVVQRVDAETGKIIGDQVCFPMPAHHVTISPDGELYAVLYREPDSSKPVKCFTSIRRCADDQPIVPDQPHDISVAGLSFSDDRDLLLVEGRNRDGRKRFCVLDVQSHTAVVEWSDIEKMKIVGTGPDGITIAIEGKKAPRRFVQLQGTQHQQNLTLAWSSSLDDPSHQFTAVQSTDGVAILRLPRIQSRRAAVLEADPKFNWWQTVHVAENQKSVVTANGIGATVFDVPTGLPTMIARHPGKMLAVALSSDGELCATSATDERATDVRVWNVDSGELRLPPLPHNNTVSVLAFSPDGEILAAGDYDGVVLLWDISTGALIGKPLEQRDIVTCLSFSRDGTRLVVGTASDWNHDPQARLWNVSTQKPIGEPMRHGNYVRRVVLVPMETEC